MIEQKRAIEALRSGVPNRDAVNSLGTSQDAIVEHFETNLERLSRNERPGGFMFKGEFGSGKSHLLEYLQHIAERQNFVTSKIVISKETPLHDAGKVFRSAIENARVPGKVGSALTAITESLRYDSRQYADFYRWVNDHRTGLNERFHAALYLFENLKDLEFSDRILRFWSGDTIAVGDLKRKLKECGETSTYSFSKALSRDLAVQRFRFLARLITAAGYRGLILLFDEVELIGRYSLLQRGRSYAEIARWIRGLGGPPIEGVTTVMATTGDLVEIVFNQRHDFDDVPNKFQERGDPGTAELAELGMRTLRDDAKPLEDQTEEAIERAYQKLKQIHGAAYGWSPPEVRSLSYQATRQMREYVRSWIYAWDLIRLDPTYTPQIEADKVELPYTEDGDLGGDDQPLWEEP
ncbi:MAG: BREX system ATP-binding domain-containing protein [Longimicrobiales bacterium]